MRYEPGDYVYPLDLSCAVLCRVTRAEYVPLTGKAAQLLQLQPTDEEWTGARSLQRRDDRVVPAYPRQLDGPPPDRRLLRPGHFQSA